VAAFVGFAVGDLVRLCVGDALGRAVGDALTCRVVVGVGAAVLRDGGDV
jgi:hypothetical protein